MRPRRDQDQGITLVELLVSMVIASMVFAVGGMMLTSTLRQRQLAYAKTTSQGDSRIAVELLTRDLRVAVPAPGSATMSAFAFASPTKVTFYSRAGGTTPLISQITYEIDASTKCLRRTTIPYTAGVFPVSAAKSRCVAPGLVNSSGQSLFSFHRIRVDAVTAPTEIVIPSSGYSTPTNDSPLKFIASVRATLWFKAQDKPGVAATSVDQSITLVNQSNAIRVGKIS